MTGHLAITLLLCFEQLSTLFSLLHFFFFPNTFSCKHLFFPNISNNLSTCSHSLFHVLTFFFTNSRYVLAFVFSTHSLSFLSLSPFLLLFFLHFTLFFAIPPFSVSTSILQSSLSSSFSFITYLPNLSLSHN